MKKVSIALVLLALSVPFLLAAPPKTPPKKEPPSAWSSDVTFGACAWDMMLLRENADFLQRLNWGFRLGAGIDVGYRVIDPLTIAFEAGVFGWFPIGGSEGGDFLYDTSLRLKLRYDFGQGVELEAFYGYYLAQGDAGGFVPYKDAGLRARFGAFAVDLSLVFITNYQSTPPEFLFSPRLGLYYTIALL